MRAWLANACGAVAAAGTLGAGLFVGAPDAGADAPAARPVAAAPARLMEGSSEVPLGDGLEILGRPSRMSAFWTNDQPLEIAQVYEDTWRKAGLTPERRVIDRVTSVTAPDPITGTLRQVTIMDSGDERLVLPGMMDLRALPDVTPRRAPVPVPTTAQNYDGQVADDAIALNYHGSFLVPNEPEEVVAFYREEFVKKGYQEKAEFSRGLAAGSAGVEFQRGLEWVRVVASETESKAERTGPAGTFVVVTHSRALQPEEGAE